MTYTQMISMLSSSGAVEDAVVRGFFALDTGLEDKKKVLEFLLGEKRYGQIVKLIYGGCINGNISMKRTSADYFAVTGGESTINTRYFSLFVQTAVECGISESEFVPMFFTIAASDKKSPLYVWHDSSVWYLTKLASVDYGKAWEYLRKNDPDFKLVSVLLEADGERAIRDLIELAMFGKGVNKVAIRKILRGYKSEVLASVRPLYPTLKNDGKIAAVRLLMLFKNDSDVGKFLAELEVGEKSQSVRKLLAGRAVRRQEIEEKPDKRKVLKFFYDAMVLGTEFSVEEFTTRLIVPPFSCIADSLFFGVYKAGQLLNIAVVDSEKVFDIENAPIEIPEDCTVKVLHPAELNSKTEFLKRLNIVQPFEQIKRKTFVPSTADKSNNACFGISGTVIKAPDFKFNMRKIGFRALNTDADGRSAQVGLLRGEVLCVLDFAPLELSVADESATVHARCVRFFLDKNVVRLGGKQFVEGVAPLSPALLEPRVFSEFMYSAYELMGCQ